MKFTVNMYMSLTCIIYCDAGCGRLIKLHASTVCRFLSRISYLSSYVFFFQFGVAVALLRESYTFV